MECEEVSWWRSVEAGDISRLDAPEPGRGFSASSSWTGESSRSVGVRCGWLVLESLSLSRFSSRCPPRLDSHDLEHYFPSTWASWMGHVKDRSLPE